MTFNRLLASASPFIMLALLALFSSPVFALIQNNEELEINFREQPNQLYQELYKASGSPLVFNGPMEFKVLADELGFEPAQLHRTLEVLARLNLERSLKSNTKIADATLLITQLESIASTPLEESVVLMLKARLMARDKQDFTNSVNIYNQALAKIADEQDMASILFKYTLHEHLSELHYMLLQEVPALSHLNRYRAIAYQLRNDYFIAQTESALGLYYNKQKELAKSLQHYSEAFTIANRLNYPGIKAHAQYQLARTYRDLEQWDDALKHAHAAASSFQKLDQKPYVSQALTVIAMTYAAQEEWNKAIDYYFNAQQVDEKAGNSIGEALNFHNIGEAYKHLGNQTAAVKYLQMANDLFKQKKTLHYLVYNELLFAQLTVEEKDWQNAVLHANAALTIAKNKNLAEEQIEALDYLTQAYGALGDLPSTINVLKTLLELNKNSKQPLQNDMENLSLTEQKLKFELNLLQAKNSEFIQQKQNSHMGVFALIIAIALLLPLLYSLYRYNRNLRHKVKLQRHSLALEPTTQLKGYQGLIKHLAQNHKGLEQQHNSQTQQTLVLARIESLANCELFLGQSQANSLMQMYIEYFESQMNASVYIIHSGLLGFYFDTNTNVIEIAEKLKSCLTELALNQRNNLSFNTVPCYDNSYSLGHVNLPLHPNPDVHISPEVEFETAQFALAAALSVGKKDSYLSLRALNFAPAATFFKPLYLNLTQATLRGMIRVDSNYPTNEINWPKH
ncbi:lipopolysaccharide assembly protein LapB [Shewanella sp. SR44-3]|uniref:tetratricopeptide repeat protein n=1 Tax=Shewanella sp. SR44-3 TaxID=2760936 RepID=UPI0015F97DD5|nr:tetratricopeptide repeat protein [Shewanella sp. SR44-3]MBB1269871.1 tetratricopeptide repeat protein [Shewanella sp. SR44-3]